MGDRRRHSQPAGVLTRKSTIRITPTTRDPQTSDGVRMKHRSSHCESGPIRPSPWMLPRLQDPHRETPRPAFGYRHRNRASCVPTSGTTGSRMAHRSSPFPRSMPRPQPDTSVSFPLVGKEVKTTNPGMNRSHPWIPIPKAATMPSTTPQEPGFSCAHRIPSSAQPMRRQPTESQHTPGCRISPIRAFGILPPGPLQPSKNLLVHQPGNRADPFPARLRRGPVVRGPVRVQRAEQPLLLHRLADPGEAAPGALLGAREH